MAIKNSSTIPNYKYDVTRKAIAEYLELHYTTINPAIKRYEAGRNSPNEFIILYQEYLPQPLPLQILLRVTKKPPQQSIQMPLLLLQTLSRRFPALQLSLAGPHLSFLGLQR
jgi:hypothetical protein